MRWVGLATVNRVAELLGIALAHPRIALEACTSLHPEWIEDDFLQAVHRCMLQLLREERTTTVGSVQNRLQLLYPELAIDRGALPNLHEVGARTSAIDYKEALRDIEVEHSRKKILANVEEVKKQIATATSVDQMVDLAADGIASLLPGRTSASEVDGNQGICDWVGSLVGEQEYREFSWPFYEWNNQRKLRSKQIVLFGAPSGHGKALANGTPVITPNGPVEIQDLKVGDSICSIDGGTTRVSGVYPQGVRPSYLVKFNDGTEIVADEDHLWQVSSPDDVHAGKSRVVTTSYLASNLFDNRGVARWRIPISSPVYMKKKNLPIDPYILGVLLGDGCFRGNYVFFTNSNEQIVENVSNRLPEGFVVSTFKDGKSRGIKPIKRLVKNPILEATQTLGLMGKGSAEKFIPDEYLYASRVQRLDLLRGLLDTDGWVEGRSSIRFSSASKDLSDGVASLVLSLGGTVRRSEKNAAYVKEGIRKECGKSYVVSIAVPENIRPFSIHEKSSRLELRKNSLPRKIISIERVEDRECTCITVEHESRLFIAGDFIVTHNSWFGLQMLEKACEDHYRVALFSIEMSPEEQFARLLQMNSGISEEDLAPGQFNYEAAKERIEQLRSYHYTILTGTTNIQRIKSTVLRARAIGQPYHMLIVDHMHLLDVGSRDYRLGLNQALTEFRSLANEQDLAIILLAQLRRPPQDNPDYRPRMTDFRESSGIEQIANFAFLMKRQEEADGNESPYGTIWCDKHRNGPRFKSIEVMLHPRLHKLTETAAVTTWRGAGV